ncbi:MAG: flagellar basal body L-ring protein FlgH, partial [Candidatus Thiodiazotropha sp.]
MKRLLSTLTFALFLSALLSGCQTTGPTRDAEYAPIRPVMPPPMPTGNGSIYQAGYEMIWFEDIVARRVGDMLTVTLVENTQANKSATTSTAKSAEVSLANPTLFGSTPQFNT